jgi:hypothetical protein
MRPTASAELYAARLLDAVPTRNAAVHAERRGQTLVLWIPLRRRWWVDAVAWALPLRGRKGFALDVLGEEVWNACDGNREVERIIEEFAARHRVRFHDARVSVLQFLRTLVERKLVAIVVEGEPLGSEERGS